MILGCIGGLLGGAFIYFNNRYNIIRKYYLKEKWQKILESVILILVTTTIVFFAPYAFRSYCVNDIEGISEMAKQYLCPDGYYNPLATILFNTQSTSIKAMLDNNANFEMG